MKQEVTRLFNDFPNLLDLLVDLRENREMSYVQISQYFNGLGYKGSRSLFERLIKKHIGYIKRSLRGKNNSFYGKTHGVATRKKISAKRIQSGVSKGKNNPMYGKTGKNSPAWKGGKSSTQAVFYASGEWVEKRMEVMTRDNFTCQKCGFTPLKTKNSLNVHHIHPLSVYWEKRLDDCNLITLCVSCHKKTFGIENDFVDLFEGIVRTSYANTRAK